MHELCILTCDCLLEPTYKYLGCLTCGGLPVLNAVSFPLMRPGWNNPYKFTHLFLGPKNNSPLRTGKPWLYIQPPKCKHFPGGEYCLQPLWKRGTLEERISRLHSDHSGPTTDPSTRPTERREAVCIEVLQKIAASVQCNEVEELQSRLIEERRNFKHGLVVVRCFLGGEKAKGSFFLFLRIPLENIWKNQEHLSFGAVSFGIFSAFSTPLDWLEPTFCFQKTRRCRSWRSQDMAEDSYVLEASNKKLSGRPNFTGISPGKAENSHDLQTCITSFFWKFLDGHLGKFCITDRKFMCVFQRDPRFVHLEFGGAICLENLRYRVQQRTQPGCSLTSQDTDSTNCGWKTCVALAILAIFGGVP